MKKFLIIDTATKDSSISLLIEESITSIPLLGLQQTKDIIPIIQSLLETNNLSITDLDGIAICTGPGTYTGTRVGVMTAKTLSYATNIPLYPFSTFDLFEDDAPYAILDAKCGRCHLKSPDGKVSLINHQDLKMITDPVHSLEIKPFPKELSNLKSSKKSLSNLSSVLNKIRPIVHSDLEITYPSHN